MKDNMKTSYFVIGSFIIRNCVFALIDSDIFVMYIVAFAQRG